MAKCTHLPEKLLMHSGRRNQTPTLSTSRQSSVFAKPMLTCDWEPLSPR